MVVPAPHLQQIVRWCRARIPKQFQDKLRVEYQVRGQSVTIVERRDPEWTSRPIAQLRYDEPSAAGQWDLYWASRDKRWLCYPKDVPAPDPDALLTEIDRDPLAVFWS